MRASASPRPDVFPMLRMYSGSILPSAAASVACARRRRILREGHHVTPAVVPGGDDPPGPDQNRGDSLGVDPPAVRARPVPATARRRGHVGLHVLVGVRWDHLRSVHLVVQANAVEGAGPVQDAAVVAALDDLSRPHVDARHPRGAGSTATPPGSARDAQPRRCPADPPALGGTGRRRGPRCECAASSPPVTRVDEPRPRPGNRTSDVPTPEQVPSAGRGTNVTHRTVSSDPPGASTRRRRTGVAIKVRRPRPRPEVSSFTVHVTTSAPAATAANRPLGSTAHAVTPRSSRGDALARKNRRETPLEPNPPGIEPPTSQSRKRASPR